MTIQRQYSLPNCTLILEGFGESSGGQVEFRPLMSVLTNAECHFTGNTQHLSGGRDFFESLVIAVSRYAQEFFSGIHQPLDEQSRAIRVQFQKVERNLHRLSVESKEPLGTSQTQIAQLELTTPQLFDLVEAVDQFFADSQTLPDLDLKLMPASKKYASASTPIAERVAPAAIGVSGLVAAAAVLFLLPIPEVKKPEDPRPKSANTPAVGASPSPGSSSTPAATSSPSPSPTTTAPASPSPTQTPSATELEAALNSAQEITDPAQLDELGKKLYSQLNEAWKQKPALAESLIYRVGVAQDGSIIGYKPTNDVASANVKQTPLLDLLYIPGANTPSRESIAQFQVAFTPGGAIEVSPWQTATTAASGQVEEITQPEQLKDLTSKLYDQLDQNWQDKPTFEQDLVFRVRVNQAGAIADYEARSPSASNYLQEVPLSKLSKPADPVAPAKEPLALFKVVFKPNGVLQVSPWRGVPQ